MGDIQNTAPSYLLDYIACEILEFIDNFDIYILHVCPVALNHTTLEPSVPDNTVTSNKLIHHRQHANGPTVYFHQSLKGNYEIIQYGQMLNYMKCVMYICNISCNFVCIFSSFFNSASFHVSFSVSM